MENYYNKSVEEVIRQQGANLEKGLTGREAERRLNEQGPNKLKEGKGRSLFAMFIDQFKDMLIIILLLAALISALLGGIKDTVVIAIILVLNATLGVIQEYKAEKSLTALKEMAAPTAHVLRDGQRQKIPASLIVPGDLVLLEAGDYVPADLRLFSVADLKLEESALTGESVPVSKETGLLDRAKAPLGERNNMAFMGTAVTYGRGMGIVTATGMDTEMGQIAELLEESVKEITPLQKRLDRMGKKLGLITLVIVSLVIIVGLWRGIEFFDIFMTGISLAVAAVPEGLPAVVTIVLALGVQRMIKKNAIVRRLPAVETLGATTIICSDKTGTLTQNQMTVKGLYLPGRKVEVTGEGYKPEGRFLADGEEVFPEHDQDLALLLKAAALCNNAELKEKEGSWGIIGDPTEASLIVTAAKAGYHKTNLEQAYLRLQELPFDSKRKRMSTINQTPEGQKTAFVKGAPDEIIKLCNFYWQQGKKQELTAELRQKIVAVIEEYAGQALRVLAVAYKPVQERGQPAYTIEQIEQELIFVGLLGMIDPPRREVAESVQTCKKAGIKPIMITGDYPITAKAIAAQLGLYAEGDRIITGAELDELSAEELAERVSETSVFARVSPADKSRIVDALQKKKQVVAMTGDGVNDAPALKEADIGVAMGITGTDVAKEAADLVLTDDNFASIVAAVGEGRLIYQNIKKFIRFLLSCNIGEVITLFLALIIGWPRPLIPIQILWVNLITDGFPALALGVDPAGEDLMQQAPRNPEEGIFAGKMAFNIGAQGLFVGLITLAAFYLGRHYFSLPVARTMAFGTLSFSQLSQALNARSERYSIFRLGLLSNRSLVLAIAISGFLQFFVLLFPPLQAVFAVVSLSALQWLLIIGLALAPLIFVEVLKALGISYVKEKE